MFPLLRKSLLPFLLSRSSFSSLQLRRLPIPFTVRQFSCPSPPVPRWKHITEDEYNLKVLVCWDFETCGVPSGVSYSKVAPSITGALRTKGFKGPIHIQAYGNLYQLSEINHEILSSTGVDLHHVPGGRRNSSRFLTDWINQKHRRGAHLLLISGDRDRDFVFTLNRLSLNYYSILFAYPERGEPDISYASTITWRWSNILEGNFLDNPVYLDD